MKQVLRLQGKDDAGPLDNIMLVRAIIWEHGSTVMVQYRQKHGTGPWLVPHEEQNGLDNLN